MEEGAIAKELLPDAFWARIAPLLPPEPPKPKGGRPRVSDRAALTGKRARFEDVVATADAIAIVPIRAKTRGSARPLHDRCTAAAIVGT